MKKVLSSEHEAIFYMESNNLKPFTLSCSGPLFQCYSVVSLKHWEPRSALVHSHRSFFQLCCFLSFFGVSQSLNTHPQTACFPLLFWAVAGALPPFDCAFFCLIPKRERCGIEIRWICNHDLFKHKKFSTWGIGPDNMPLLMRLLLLLWLISEMEVLFSGSLWINLLLSWTEAITGWSFWTSKWGSQKPVWSLLDFLSFAGISEVCVAREGDIPVISKLWKKTQ